MKKPSLKTIIIWSVIILLTIGSAVFQRLTGPTYPVTGTIQQGKLTIDYTFLRSSTAFQTHAVAVKISDPNASAVLEWKRHKTNDAWTAVPMLRDGNVWRAELPAQPKAGKLDYYVIIASFESREQIRIPATEPVVIRFKGDVPDQYLIPHIILIFLSMVFSLRTAVAVFQTPQLLKRHLTLTFITLIGGGFIFGPLVQLYAFDALWTGFPFGFDLTDNKTLVALLAWCGALVAVIKQRYVKVAVLIAAIIMFIVFLIPHSLFGSELKYDETMPEKAITTELLGN